MKAQQFEVTTPNLPKVIKDRVSLEVGMYGSDRPQLLREAVAENQRRCLPAPQPASEALLVESLNLAACPTVSSR
jgi:hypothetical protein